MNDKNIAYQIVWDTGKAMPRWIYMIQVIYLKKLEKRIKLSLKKAGGIK